MSHSFLAMPFNFASPAHETGTVVACRVESLLGATQELSDKLKKLPGPPVLEVPFSASRSLICFPFLLITKGTQVYCKCFK